MVFQAQGNAATTPTLPLPTGTPTFPSTINPATGLATPWYQTWWGIGALALIGILIYKRTRKPSSSAQKAA